MGGDGMDQVLKEICLDIINDDIDSEHFSKLLIASGVMPEGFEWQIANRLLDKGDGLKEQEKIMRKIMH